MTNIQTDGPQGYKKYLPTYYTLNKNQIKLVVNQFRFTRVLMKSDNICNYII